MEQTSHLALDKGSRVDFHTHILPCVDDGSKSVDESLQMLRILADSGVGAAVMTPHFYAGSDTPELFIARRTEAFETLAEAASKDSKSKLPQIIPGAEVEYFGGIECLCDYPELRVGNSGCMLVEMPQKQWATHVVDDIIRLNEHEGFRVILAHVERYLFDQKKDVIYTLLDHGILMQSNAAYFINRLTARKAFRMLKLGYVHLIGSDCHNLTIRPPNIGAACDEIAKHAGEEVLENIMSGARHLLRNDLT